MKLSKTTRALLSVTALAWSIPFAQAAEERGDADEDGRTLELRSRSTAAPAAWTSIAGDHKPGSGHGRTPRG